MDLYKGVQFVKISNIGYRREEEGHKEETGFRKTTE